ncbi:MAG: hypothetical protein ACLT3H_14005 [Roseburia sp.]
MKTLSKKITSLFLSLILVFSLSSTAFAAENLNTIHKQDIIISEVVRSGVHQLDDAGLDGDLIEKILAISNHI